MSLLVAWLMTGFEKAYAVFTQISQKCFTKTNISISATLGVEILESTYYLSAYTRKKLSLEESVTWVKSFAWFRLYSNMSFYWNHQEDLQLFYKIIDLSEVYERYVCFKIKDTFSHAQKLNDT